MTEVEPRKLLFVAEPAGIAHTARLNAIAEAVVYAAEDSAEVVFAVTPEQDETIATGSSVARVSYPAAESMGEAMRNYQDLLSDVAPDEVVVDGNIAAMLAVVREDIPVALVINSYFMPYHIGVAGEETTTMSNRAIAHFANGVLRYKLRSYAREANLPFGGDIDSILAGVPIIFPEWPGYIPLKRQLPNFNYVGPVILDRLEGEQPDFEQRALEQADCRPIVYVSFGGSGMPAEKLTEIVDQLSEKDYFLIVSLGRTASLDKLHLPEDNGIVAKYVPGLSASNAANVIVSHGSQGMVTHAIMTGTPIVCLPYNFDQSFHSYKAQEYGMGVNLHRLPRKLDFFRTYNPSWLKKYADGIPSRVAVEAVTEVLESSRYTQHAKQVQTRFGTVANGSRKAAEVILRTLI